MKIAYFSRYNHFSTPFLEEFEQHHSVKVWKDNTSQMIRTFQMQNLMEWCDVAFLEWAQYPNLEITQGNFEKPLILFCHGTDVFNHVGVDWRNVAGLIIQDSSYERLKMLRSEWKKRQSPRLPNLPEKCLIQSIGVNTDLFTYSDREPEYHIAIHSSPIKPVKRVYTAIQQFYSLIHIDYNKPWRMTIIGPWTSKDPLDEYIQAVNELIVTLDFPPNRLGVIPRDLPLEKWVQFAGGVDIYWCTSYAEGFGVSMAECVSRGATPFVNHYLGAEKIYPEEYLCKTSNQMIQKTIEWGNLPVEEKVKLRQESSKLMENYDCRKAAKNIREFIEEIVNE
jgi:glycosyltransferase involved in cell wall biosynthesis